MAYAPSHGTRKNTMDLIFIVKLYDEDITYSYEKAICVFDRNKFYKVDEIYSIKQSDKHYKQVNLAEFEKDLDWYTLTRKWSKNDKYMLISYKEIFNIYGFKPWW